MAQEIKPFQPVIAPPSDHHGPNTGLSTELGDSFKTAVDKINAGFAHVYTVLKEAGASVGSAIADPTAEIKALEARLGDIVQAHAVEVGALQMRVAALEQAAKTAAPQVSAPAVETVAKSEFDALNTQFHTLATRIEKFLGLVN